MIARNRKMLWTAGYGGLARTCRSGGLKAAAGGRFVSGTVFLTIAAAGLTGFGGWFGDNLP